MLGSGVINKQLANELYKPIIRNFKRRKVYCSYKDNIWGVDLADMSFISKFNKEIKYLLCVIDLFSRYSWVVGLKDKKGASLLMNLKKYSIVQKGNQIKYGQIMEANFIIKFLKIFLKKMT